MKQYVRREEILQNFRQAKTRPHYRESWRLLKDNNVKGNKLFNRVLQASINH
jgi:hypothetical protein